jgi:predicted sulfurtransferase
MVQVWTNISAYRFVDMPDYEEMRTPLRQFCNRLGIKGTILLSHEGINIFLSAPRDKIEAFLEHLQSDERFANLTVKFSESDSCAFRRMNVRLKKEIISMGMKSVKPAEFSGPHIDPVEFKQWLDESRDITILDTRNDYEIRMGTFEGSVDFDITSFRDFPEAVAQCDLPKDKPVVMFCTGGIRCEKASVVMLEAGFKDVRQINGGILNYFEKTGGDYWNGECFVFDRRVGVDVNLNETASEMCWACRAPLSVEEQKNPDFVQGVSCLYCIGGKT